MKLEGIVKRQADPRDLPLYPIALNLQYRVLSRGRLVAAGGGRTVRFGSRQVVFTAEPAPDVTTRLQISVAWPALLDGRVKLQLVIEGRVSRVDGNLITLGVVKHRFRTRGLAAAPSAQPRALPMPVIPIDRAANARVALGAHA